MNNPATLSQIELPSVELVPVEHSSKRQGTGQFAPQLVAVKRPFTKRPLARHFKRDGDGLIALEDRRTNQCCWPFDTPNGTRFCGHPAAHYACSGEVGYCDFHWARRTESAERGTK